VNNLNEKIYEVTIENNTNIKHLMRENSIIKSNHYKLEKRVMGIENNGKKTIKEHLISFSKICAAFVIISGAYNVFIPLVKKLWQ